MAYIRRKGFESMSDGNRLRCESCEREMLPFDLDLTLGTPAPHTTLLEDAEWTGVCCQCITRGYTLTPDRRRASSLKPARKHVVVENCEFHIANGVGLIEAAKHEGYSTSGNLRTVLRRWGRADLEKALVAIDVEQDRRLSSQSAESSAFDL